MTYKAAPNGQFVPKTVTSPKNCMGATGAAICERATVGAIRLTHDDFRKHARARGAADTRGLFPNEVVNAAKDLAGVTIKPVYGLSRTAMKDTVVGGSGCGCSIDTSVTRYTSRRTNSYVGAHQVYVNAYQWWPGGAYCECEKRLNTAHGEYLVDDPGTTSAGFLWWSADLLYRAAEKRTNGNGINLLVGPDTEKVIRKCVMVWQVRKQPNLQAPTNGPLQLGASYTVHSTLNGGPWDTAKGGKSTGWHKITVGYVPGRALK